MERKDLTGNQIRQMFLDFFKEKGFMIEPGASLVPHNDPTLLWINAGVSALKKYFDGTEKPQCPRIANAQKSIRTNDIENVGKTARHHTFFEMLGNFSIGDYFKKEAIPWAWEFLTSDKWIGFDPKRLYVTVYPDDQEAYELWVKTGMIESHIRKSADNFWEIGRGPGGPDTELYYDRGEKYDPDHIGERLFFEDIENDRYVELWNIVFSQYDCRPGEVDRSEYKELPQKNIDTGMGLERLVCMVQDGETNFDTDLFLPIIHQTEKYAKHSYSEPEYKMAYRVIADHIRTVTFAVADGAMFSNEGRGYVLRRVLRRAVRYGIKLGIEGSFMYKLVPTVASNMYDYYPYVSDKVELISKLVKNEEESFHKTLSNGEALLNQALKQHEDSKQLPGEVVFKLYDTYGYPKELTTEIALDAGYTIDEKGFEQQMEAQRQRARDARGDAQSMSGQAKDLMDFVQESKFVGYTDLKATAKVIALFKNGEKVDSISDSGQVIFDITPFYAESGGQIGDHGTIVCDSCNAKVVDTKKAPHGQHLSTFEVIEGELKVNDEVNLTVNALERTHARANHSSLHLLQSALIKVLGNHIAQAGSYVCPDYGRFDFTHFEKVTSEQLDQVEAIVNGWIDSEYEVSTQVMDIASAKQSGAIALFDEKYGDTVRVVSMGDVSKEFCAGTHVANLSQIGCFKILSEESIGSGVRRITVVTKEKAYQAFKKQQHLLTSVEHMVNAKTDNDVIDRVEKLNQEITSLNNQVNNYKNEQNNIIATQLSSKADNINGYNVVVSKVDANSSNIKTIATLVSKKLDNALVGLVCVSDDKISIVVSCCKQAIDGGKSAGNIVKAAAQLANGNGGGKADIAQAGAKDVNAVDKVLDYLKQQLA